MSEPLLQSPDPQGMPIERQSLEVDIVCVGMGPATGGFLTTLTRQLLREDGTPLVESITMPGVPPQIVCYERADDIGFGVSGVATRARGIRSSFPELDPSQIPTAIPVKHEKVVYLLDPMGASQRSRTLRVADRLIRTFKSVLPFEEEALSLPYVPEFLRKDGGLLLSIGQFNQWVGSQLMGSGLVQIWPGTPVAEPLIEDNRVVGVRLIDQGTNKQGQPDVGYLPGMNIRAGLTVVGDGPVGPIGRKLDEYFGMPEGHHRYDWAVGSKVVIDLPEDCPLESGAVIHTFGFPEPEIFGFLYVYADHLASAGIFVPSWFDSPVRTSYRYLQHWMLHPYLWRYLRGGSLRSWGAKTLQESGRHGEPFLVGHGYARIGEGSGSTNVLTGSGVDEAWTTGVLLAEGVIELLKAGRSFTRENLEQAYVRRRRASWIEGESQVSEKARNGFQRGVLTGLIGMGLTGLTGGRLNLPGWEVPPYKRLPSLEAYYHGKISPQEISELRKGCASKGISLHDALMERCGWPPIPFDGRLLISHQDALLLGGKVQAPAGYPDHVVFLYPHLCKNCETQVCVEVCSGQAISPGQSGVPEFDREKCVHCGACVWNCAQPHPEDPDRSNVEFRAGAGGLHSAEN
jgi:electron-transferring-flavoprotein dehydrogenase